MRRPDQFMAALSDFFNELSKNYRAVLAVVVAILVLGGAGILVSSRKEARAEEARNALYLAIQAVQADAKRVAEAEPKPVVDPKAAKAKQAAPVAASPETIEYKKLDVDAEFSRGVQMLKAVTEKYNDSRTVFEARLQLGDLYYRHGQPAKAVSWYQEAAQGAPGPFPKSLAFSSWGYALESSGKASEAIPVYEKAINIGEASLKGDLLLAIARCHGLLNDSAKARSTYDQILSQLPNTEYARQAEALKAKL